MIYFYYHPEMPLFLLTMYGKGEKDNLSKAERNQMSKAAAMLVQEWEKRA